MNVSVSLHLLEKDKGDVIFGSLKEDRAKGDWGKWMCEGETHGGIGGRQEPEGHGGK